MATFLITFFVLLIVVLAMAVGVIFSDRKIKGSCGGIKGIEGMEDECSLCSNKTCEKNEAVID